MQQRTNLYNVRHDLGSKEFPLRFRITSRNHVNIIHVTGPAFSILIDYDARANHEWFFNMFADRSREVAAVYRGVDGKMYADYLHLITHDLLISEEGSIYLANELPPEEFS